MNNTDLSTENTVYVTYLSSDPGKVWEALTSSKFTEQYFFGRTVESTWELGARWLLRRPDGGVDVTGEVREVDPPHKLALSWLVDEDLPECIVTYELEPVSESVVRLTMTEAHPTPIPAPLLEGGRKGWPMILSGLKTLLETGQPLKIPVPGPPSA